MENTGPTRAERRSLGMSVDVPALKHVMQRVKVEGKRLAKQTQLFKVPEAAEVFSPVKLL